MGAMIQPAGLLADRKPFELRPFTITPFLVDHSAFDAYALLVEAGGRRLFYSGDLRGHGRNAASSSDSSAIRLQTYTPCWWRARGSARQTQRCAASPRKTTSKNTSAGRSNPRRASSGDVLAPERRSPCEHLSSCAAGKAVARPRPLRGRGRGGDQRRHHPTGELGRSAGICAPGSTTARQADVLVRTGSGDRVEADHAEELAASPQQYVLCFRQSMGGNSSARAVSAERRRSGRCGPAICEPLPGSGFEPS